MHECASAMVAVLQAHPLRHAPAHGRLPLHEDAAAVLLRDLGFGRDFPHPIRCKRDTSKRMPPMSTRSSSPSSATASSAASSCSSNGGCSSSLAMWKNCVGALLVLSSFP